MVISHSSILRPSTLWWWRLIAHALIPVCGLRHLSTRSQLSPRQFSTTRAKAPTLESTACAAKIPVLHICSYLQALPNIQPETEKPKNSAPAKSGTPRGALLCRVRGRGGSQPHNWMSNENIELCRLQMISDTRIAWLARRTARLPHLKSNDKPNSIRASLEEGAGLHPREHQ